MPKEEWGTKRVCPTTGRRFYDLGRDPIVSPYTGEVVVLETGKPSRTAVADKTKSQTAKEKEVVEDEDDVVLEDDDEADVDLGDDVLEDDDDDSDDVSLDDIADVATDDDD